MSEEPDPAAAVAALLEGAVLPRLLGLTLPLFWPDERQDAEILGSGVVVRIGDVPMLLTAAHVLKAGRERGIAIEVSGEYRLLSGRMIQCHADGATTGDDDFIDVGVLFLESGAVPAETLTLGDLEIHPEAQQDPGPYVLLGYPESRNRRARDGEQFRATAYPILAHGAEDAEYAALGRDQRVQLVLPFDRKDVWRSGVRVTAPNLYGMSGGGVWHIPLEAKRSSLRPQLAAIAVEWQQRAAVKHILTTRIQPVLALLAAAEPMVKTAIEEWVAAEHN